jgi:hypothetical protein
MVVPPCLRSRAEICMETRVCRYARGLRQNSTPVFTVDIVARLGRDTTEFYVFASETRCSTCTVLHLLLYIAQNCDCTMELLSLLISFITSLLPLHKAYNNIHRDALHTKGCSNLYIGCPGAPEAIYRTYKLGLIIMQEFLPTITKKMSQDQ